MSETGSKVRLIQVGTDDQNQRLDNYLARHLKGVPKGHIYRLIRKGEVRINKGRAKPDYRLKAGDTVRIPPVRISETKPAASPGQSLLTLLANSILFEDKTLLVLNKPSGVAVHGGSGLSYGVIEAMRKLRPEESLELVHRLDRETSGCLMIAKRRSTLRQLHESLREGEMDKRYLALVEGHWDFGTLKVSAPLRKDTLRGGERMVRVSDDGKPATTIFSPVEPRRRGSLIEARLETGRTHQIRVHAAHQGHPLAGDEKYGNESFNQAMVNLGLKRLFLHAHSLAFEVKGNPIHVSAPLPDELKRVLDRLESPQ